MQMIASLFAVPQERIRPGSDLFEYGGDSSTLASLLSLIEQHFQVRLETHEIFDHPDVQSLAACIVHKHTECLARQS
jgi:acyl carrier protein